MDTGYSLKDQKRWILWANINGNKTPLDGRGGKCGSTHEDKYMSLEDAEAASKRLNDRGMYTNGTALGFCLGDGLAGVDLDDCRNPETGELTDWGQRILDKFAASGAYAEVSPSGTGLKIFCLARKPEGMRCQEKCGEGMIEVYEKGRFFAVTKERLCGKAASIGDCQDAMDWLAGEYFPTPELPTRAVAVTPYNAVSSGGGPPIERAQAYLTKCGFPQKGSRNKDIFCKSGHLRTLIDDHGVGYSESVIQALILAWNSQAPEPLPEEECLRAIKSSGRNGTPRAAKPPEEREDFEAYDNVKIELGTKKKEEKPAPSLPVSGLGTFLDTYIEYAVGTATLPQPELALAGGLSLLSAVTGPKARMQWQNFATRTNLYILGLAPSGAGKDYCRQINKRILQARKDGDKIDLEVQRMLGPERIGSSAGLATSVQEGYPHFATLDGGFGQSILMQLDEFGRLLATINSRKAPAHLMNIATVLMQLYTSSASRWVGDAYADSSKTPIVDQPHCVIYGTGVPEGFWASMDEESSMDGLLGRMMIFSGTHKDYQRPRLDAEESSYMLEDLRGMAKKWLVPGDGWDFKLGDGVSDYLEDVIIKTTNKMKEESAMERALWARSPEKLSKLSLLIAASRFSSGGKPEVTFDDVAKAEEININVMRRTIDDAKGRIASSEWDGTVKLAIAQCRKMADKSNPIRRSDIIRKTPFRKSALTSRQLMDSLQSEGWLIPAGEGKYKFREAEG